MTELDLQNMVIRVAFRMMRKDAETGVLLTHLKTHPGGDAFDRYLETAAECVGYKP